MNQHGKYATMAVLADSADTVMAHLDGRHTAWCAGDARCACGLADARAILAKATATVRRDSSS